MYLFIGGSLDGQRRAVQENLVRVLVLVSRPVWIADSAKVDYEHYKVFHFQADRTVFTVYALDGMKPDEIVARLIAQYAPVADARKASRPNYSSAKQDAEQFSHESLKPLMQGQV